MKPLLTLAALSLLGCSCGGGRGGDADGAGDPDAAEDPSPDFVTDPVDEDVVDDPLEEPIPDGAELMDTDGDTISDLDEGRWARGGPVDTDGDTIPDYEDDDSDGDGVEDADEAGDGDLLTPPDDCDGDGVPNYRDPDSDDDGTTDGDEVAAGTDPCVPDADGCDPFSREDQNVSNDVDEAAQEDPTIAVDSSCTIYVAWSDMRNGDWDIFLSKSTDGETWTHPDTRVDTDAGSGAQTEPAMALGPSGEVYVVWTDRRNDDSDVYLGRSTDGGETWTDPDVRINTDTGDGPQSGADIEVDSAGTIYVVWEDGRAGDWDIRFARSTDGGGSWTDPNVQINAEGASTDQRSPTIALDPAGALHVAWVDEREGDTDIYFASSGDGGDTWTDPNVRVNSDTGTSSQEYPRIAVNPTGNVSLTWLDYRNGGSDVFFAMSTDGGHTWSHPNTRINTDPDPSQQLYPAIAVSPSNAIFVGWYDNRYDKHHIYMARSTDSGRTWTDPDAEVDYSLGVERRTKPDLTVDPFGNVYSAWQDHRLHDNYVIWFRANPPHL